MLSITRPRTWVRFPPSPSLFGKAARLSGFFYSRNTALGGSRHGGRTAEGRAGAAFRGIGSRRCGGGGDALGSGDRVACNRGGRGRRRRDSGGGRHGALLHGVD